MDAAKTKSIQTIPDQVLMITRVINAPRELVFKAWTQSLHLKEWWSPKNFTCPYSEINLYPGGKYLNCMRSPEGKEFWSQGIYKEIIEPERIVSTDSFADKKGNFVSPQDYGMSSDWPDEALIEVTFSEKDGKTKLTIQHSPIKPGDERDMCRQGWNECLDKLEDHLKQIQKQR